MTGSFVRRLGTLKGPKQSEKFVGLRASEVTPEYVLYSIRELPNDGYFGKHIPSHPQSRPQMGYNHDEV